MAALNLRTATAVGCALLVGAVLTAHAQEKTTQGFTAQDMEKITQQVDKASAKDAASAASTITPLRARAKAYAKQHDADLHAVAKTSHDKALDSLRAQFAIANHGSTVPTAQQGEHILMFASLSMPAGDLRGLLETVKGNPSMTLEFQGGEKVGGVKALLDGLKKASQGLGGVPSFQINPPAFHHLHVTLVPTAVVFRNGKEVARVGGVYSQQWIDDQLTRRAGNLGNYGRMYEPSENDMEAILKQRVESFDWEGYFAKAAKDFWSKPHTTPVPHSEADGRYLIDPSVVITHDIRTPKGEYLAHKGQRINPLAKHEFMDRVVVIDASDPAQRAFARKLVDTPATTRLVILTTASPNPDEGWKEWAKWQDDLHYRLYAYTRVAADRFHIHGTPSVITGDGHYLRVTQYKVD